uniref:Tetratricopeptide repeat protein n=1 Tax=Prevotella sp. GTC17260 TaxID=3236796 RepID=A0AB33J849_9BACT
MSKRLPFFISLFYIILWNTQSVAQTISVSVPHQVAVGENFRLSYTISTQDVDDFRAGNIPSALEVLAGPYTSSQSSYQISSNGRASSSSSTTYTYTLYAAKNGTYIIPPAIAVINGKKYASRAAKVEVSGHTRNTTTPQMHEDNNSQMRSSGSRISGNDLFIKVSANKRVVHEQEPILLTYKVYTLLDLTQLEGKMPDLTGFHTQEIKLPQQKNFHVENVNGKNYRCVTWSQYVMYPQITGKLTIPSITFKGIVVQQNRNVDPLEAFFNGGSGYVEVKRNIVAPSIDVQVLPLPARPANFSGGVGTFNISAQLNKNQIKTGEPIQLRISISGVGNLKLIKQPEIKLPKDFDKYAPKVTDKTQLTAQGVEGSMIYDYIIVPRNVGQYDIPPIEFVYYDTPSNSYRTISTQPFKLNVTKGNGATNTVSNFSAKENDIREIKRGNVDSYDIHQSFFESTTYWLLIILPIGTFGILLFAFRKRAKENADVIGAKGKKANKVANKRLKKAKGLMELGNHHEFYDEVLKALWGYVGDKMNIPVEELSRENISEKLQTYHVDHATISMFISAIDECEYERYAPRDVAGNMNKTFDAAMTAIMDIENVMNKKQKHYTPFIVWAIFLGSLLPTMAIAANKNIADKAYLAGDYQLAIKEYTQLIKTHKNAILYYNLGNAYYRTNDITHAVLFYERALQLEPGNKDIRFNLQFARSKTIDKIGDDNEMFFITWYKSCVNFTSVDNWAYISIVMLICFLTFFLLYLFSERMILRKSGFYASLCCLCICIISIVFSYQQKYNLQHSTGAIVMTSSAAVYKTPTQNNAAQFTIHEGTKVDLLDQGMKGWANIKLADGREGWILATTIEKI